MCHKYDIAD